MDLLEARERLEQMTTRGPRPYPLSRRDIQALRLAERLLALELKHQKDVVFDQRTKDVRYGGY